MQDLTDQIEKLKQQIAQDKEEAQRKLEDAHNQTYQIK